MPRHPHHGPDARGGLSDLSFLHGVAAWGKRQENMGDQFGIEFAVFFPDDVAADMDYYAYHARDAQHDIVFSEAQ